MDDELVMSLVEQAMALSSSERTRFLQNACGGNDALLMEVSDIVAEQEIMGNFLMESPPLEFEEDCTFLKGQVVADRFEIIGEIGEGGMARVYQATDLLKNIPVAVKVPKFVFKGWLLPEVVNALKVAHNNICRVHDIHRVKTGLGEVDFLTMEFIDGETLRARIGRQPVLTAKEKTAIATQICSGLDEAHRKGIIHGDLKPNNVLLTYVDSRLRAVVSDFGLARSLRSEGQRDLSSPRLGAPGYVAPEVAEGGSYSIASDVFSLGVVLYELVAGQRPWRSSAGTEVRAPGAVKFPPGVPLRWRRVIKRCLAKDPSARPQSAAAIGAELEGKRSPKFILLTCAVVLLLGLPGGWWFLQRIFPPPPLDAIRLAVLPFKGNIESKPVLLAATIEFLDRLGRLQRDGRGLIVIPPNETAKNGVDTPEAAHNRLGATNAVQCEFRSMGGKVAVRATVFDARTQQEMQRLAAEYADSDVSLISKALIGTVTAGLRLHRVSLPESVAESARGDYVLGLYLNRQDAHLAYRALPYFERAAALDRRSALPYAGMVEAQVRMFETSESREWLERAEGSLGMAISRNPDALEVHLAAGHLRMAEGDVQLALDEFGRALKREPSNVDGLRMLGTCYNRAGRTEDAIRTFQRAVSVRPGDYQPHMAFGKFFWDNGVYREALNQFLEVTRLAPGHAQAHLNLGAANAKLGFYQEGEVEIRKALSLRGDRDSWTALGAVLAYQKHYPDSAKAYENAIAIGPADRLTFSNLGDAYRRCGFKSKAKSAYRRAFQLVDHELTEGNAGNGSGPARAFAGYLEARLDRPDRALSDTRQALQLAPQDSDVKWRAALVFAILGRRKICCPSSRKLLRNWWTTSAGTRTLASGSKRSLVRERNS